MNIAYFEATIVIVIAVDMNMDMVIQGYMPISSMSLYEPIVLYMSVVSVLSFNVQVLFLFARAYCLFYVIMIIMIFPLDF